MRSLRPLRTALVAGLLALVGCRGNDNQQPPKVVAPTTQSDAPNSTPNSTAAMPKDPAPAPANPAPPAAATQMATFANGCFWCTEAVLEQQPGVTDVTSGYMGGSVDNPSYQDVCTGATGHAECVQVTFDPARISYEALLDWFFRSHDPTSLNRQGADEGTQYRSAIFFHSDEQKAAALAAIKKLQPKYSATIVTEVTAASHFWPADSYHQDFFRRNPNQSYCRMVIAPKLHKLGLGDAK